MEVKTGIHARVVEWLASMGYPVSGVPEQLLRGMLLREAQQWQLSPERLETMILENAELPIREVATHASSAADARPVSCACGTTASTLQ